MLKVKIVLSDGDNFITRINATLEKVKEYYKPGTVFNVGIGPNDNLKTVKELHELIE